MNKFRRPFENFFFNLWAVLPFSLFLFASCAEKPVIKEVDFEKSEFAPFVEPDFPFISTSLDGQKLDPGFPEDNLAARVLAIKLGNEAYAAFDTDMLRWSGILLMMCYSFKSRKGI